jgi:hypothetical protein
MSSEVEVIDDEAKQTDTTEATNEAEKKAGNSVKKEAKQKADNSVKKQLLEDIEAFGGLACVGKGRTITLQKLLKRRSNFYSRYKRVQFENWLNYWRKLDAVNYSDLLQSFDVLPFAQRVGHVPVAPVAPVEDLSSDEMASTTGGPGRGGRRAAAAAAAAAAAPGNNNAVHDPDAPLGRAVVQHIGTFQLLALPACFEARDSHVHLSHHSCRRGKSVEDSDAVQGLLRRIFAGKWRPDWRVLPWLHHQDEGGSSRCGSEFQIQGYHLELEHYCCHCPRP